MYLLSRRLSTMVPGRSKSRPLHWISQRRGGPWTDHC